MMNNSKCERDRGFRYLPFPPCSAGWPWLAALCLALPLLAGAQDYTIDWHKVAGGGGVSSNGQFVVSGTIGQPDAGATMTGGNYSLTGGFWSLLSVIQTPGAPALRIFLTATNTAVLAWPAASTGYTLQQKTDVETSAWSDTPALVNQVGSENQVIVSPPAGRQFYRLYR